MFSAAIMIPLKRLSADLDKDTGYSQMEHNLKRAFKFANILETAIQDGRHDCHSSR